MLVELCQCWAVWAKLDWANRGLEFPEMGGGGWWLGGRGGGGGGGGFRVFLKWWGLNPSANYVLPLEFSHCSGRLWLFCSKVSKLFLLFTTYVTQFCLISRGESLFFYRISKGKVTKLKIAGSGAVFTTNFLRGRSSSSTLSKKENIPEYKSKRSTSKSNNKWTR